MSEDSTKGISSPFRGGILDRAQPQIQNTALSETQSEVDQLVGNAIATASDEKMMVSLFGAGLAARFVRLGTVAASGQSLAPLAVQGISHATALAGESAVFASMERGFARLEGHAVTQSFQKDWARAAINLGSIKLLGGASQGQNLILQHLMIDSGMVAGHHAGYALGVTDKPHGSIAQQMIQAEGMNWGMKGSLALLHGFSPRLSAMERSVELALKSQEAGLFSQNRPIFFFPQPAAAAEGGPESYLAVSRNGEGIEGPMIVFSKGNEEGGSGPLGRGGTPKPTGIERKFYFWIFSPTHDKWVKNTTALNLDEVLVSHEPLTRLAAVREAVNSKDPSLRSALERALADEEPIVRTTAAWALAAQGVSAGRQALERELNPLEQPDPLLREASAIILGKLGDLDWMVGADPVFSLAEDGSLETRAVLEKALLTDPEPRVRSTAAWALGERLNPAARPALEKALNDSDVNVRVDAAWTLDKIGVKSLELADTLHKMAMEFMKEADAMDRRNPKLSEDDRRIKREHQQRAIEFEWSAAAVVPPGTEPLRGVLYRSAMWMALKVENWDKARAIIFRAVREDSEGMTEKELRDSEKEQLFWNKSRKFILSALKQAKKDLKFFRTLKPAFALATTGPIKGDDLFPHIFMMSSKESKSRGGSGEGPVGSSEIGKKTPSRDPVEIIRELTELAESGNKAATEALVRIATAKPGETDALAKVARAEIVDGSRESSGASKARETPRASGKEGAGRGTKKSFWPSWMRVELLGASGKDGLEETPVLLDKKSVCINIGRYYFTENVKAGTTINNADLYIEHQGIGKGTLFITNKSGKELLLLDGEGKPRKVEKDIAYPVRLGEKFIFNGKWYTWGKLREKLWPSPQSQAQLPLEKVNSLNGRILAEEAASAVFEAGVYYGLKDEVLREGTEERTARIPVFLENSSGLIAAVGEVPEELRSETTPIILIVRIPKYDRREQQVPTVVGLAGSIDKVQFLQVVGNLTGKPFQYPGFGLPAIEHGQVILDARRFRTVPFSTGSEGEGPQNFAESPTIKVLDDATLSVPDLVTRLSDPNPMERLLAAEILGEINDSATRPHLKERLAGEQDPLVRTSIAVALSRLGDPEAFVVLKQALDHPNPEVQIRAAQALRENEEALEKLTQLAKTENPTALEVLAELGKKKRN